MLTTKERGLPGLDVLTPEPLPSSGVEDTLVGTCSQFQMALPPATGGSQLLFFKEMLVRFR